MGKNFYVVYEGDTPVGVFDSIHEVAKHFCVTLATVQFWKTEQCKVRMDRCKVKRGHIIERVHLDDSEL